MNKLFVTARGSTRRDPGTDMELREWTSVSKIFDLGDRAAYIFRQMAKMEPWERPFNLVVTMEIVAEDEAEDVDAGE